MAKFATDGSRGAAWVGAACGVRRTAHRRTARDRRARVRGPSHDSCVRQNESVCRRHRALAACSSPCVLAGPFPHRGGLIVLLRPPGPRPARSKGLTPTEYMFTGPAHVSQKKSRPAHDHGSSSVNFLLLFFSITSNRKLAGTSIHRTTNRSSHIYSMNILCHKY